jgi:hypothetical protein
MRIIELSNHPEHLRAEHEAGRRAEQARLERERADARGRLAELKAQRRQALIRLRLGAWARAAASARTIRQQLAPFPSIVSSVPSANEEIAAAGRDGEDRIAAQLDAALGDNWVLYRGYRNARGEIDGVLAGPGGLVAVEVKNVNGVIHVDGDRWRRDRYDNYGNYLGGEPLPGQLAPSVQVNQAADALQVFLGRNGHPLRIRRAVILAHPKSETGSLNALTVDAVGCSAKTVLRLLEDGATLSSQALADIERLIQRDHRYHDRRRSSGRRDLPR